MQRFLTPDKYTERQTMATFFTIDPHDPSLFAYGPLVKS